MAKQRKPAENSVKKDWKPAFLKALAGVGVVKKALEMVKVPRRGAYEAKHADPEFSAAWDAAVEESVEVLEAEAIRRAVYGVNKLVLHRGKIVATVKEYSDTLLIFMLKARKPHVYRDMTAEQLAAATAARVASKGSAAEIPIEYAVEFNMWLAAKRAAEQEAAAGEPASPVGGEPVPVVPAAGAAEPGVPESS